MMPSTAPHSSGTRSGKEALGDASFGATSNLVVFTAETKRNLILISSKIIKIIASRCPILRYKCT